MKNKLFAGIAALFASTASVATADESIRLDFMAQSDHSNTVESDVPRHPSEIMCDIVGIDSGFANMELRPDGHGGYKIYDTAPNGQEYILRPIDTQGLAHDQRAYIKFAEQSGYKLSTIEIDDRLAVAGLFDELSGSIQEFKPTSNTAPQCKTLTM